MTGLTQAEELRLGTRYVRFSRPSPETFLFVESPNWPSSPQRQLGVKETVFFFREGGLVEHYLEIIHVVF